MQYLGGKLRIAKEIATIVAPKGDWWEPFCGGLSVSELLAAYRPGVVSDVCKPLMSLYCALRAGWVPPENVSVEEYAAAKTLCDSDPLKGFTGFGCSFSGKFFGGYAKPGTYTYLSGQTQSRNYAAQAAKALRRQIDATRLCRFATISFFDIDPRTAPVPESIYADPPYQDTTGYAGVEAFDTGLFWSYCQQWATRGARVFVSEYTCPVPHKILWEKPRACQLSGAARVERLFRVL